jgi:hypothetical protein
VLDFVLISGVKDRTAAELEMSMLKRKRREAKVFKGYGVRRQVDEKSSGDHGS